MTSQTGTEAHVDLERVRTTRRALLVQGAEGRTSWDPAGTQPRAPGLSSARPQDVARWLAGLDRYEARALSRRRSAIRALDAAQVVGTGVQDLA